MAEIAALQASLAAQQARLEALEVMTIILYWYLFSNH